VNHVVPAGVSTLRNHVIEQKTVFSRLLRRRVVCEMSSSRTERQPDARPEADKPGALPRRAWGGALKRTFSEFREEPAANSAVPSLRGQQLKHPARV
jgi:hypothetical protein